ncbi:MAG TPA: DISARM system phospholipase D-like protein DrmC [Kofleriaceae bacterium]|nr:DISARM system phospholipase D-like protein DrmC [Kofleriaceae bacterium]
MNRRGVWELSTPRLEQLLVALARRGGEAVTAVGLQQDGFDLAICGGLAGLTSAAATLVVESVLAERTLRPRPELELVWTGRESGATLSRDTSQVLPQLFTRAERRVIVAGFAFYEASNIFEPLHARACDAGIEVEFFIHVDGTGHNARMSPSNFFTYSWPWHDVTPRLYYDARVDTADASFTMHAKCIIVDDFEVLITSANFTGRAQHDNVELGVLIRDGDFAARVSGQWHTLVTRGLFRAYVGEEGAAR